MSSTYCNFIKKGLFVSHRGVSLCCINPVRYKMMPSKFWYGYARETALKNMDLDQNVKGCDICYNNENKKTTSARIFYNYYENIPNKNLPTILDLDFSNFCNLKCIMCNPTRSSEWAKDEGKGISVISKDLINDLFSISKDVVQMTIQGGEPSIMHEYEYYFKLLDKANVAKNIDLQVITNATNVNNRFYSLLERFKSVRLSVSIDAYDLANDYIRWPSKFNQIEKNLIKIADLKKTVRVEILNSLNILSLFNYNEFLTWCKKIENIYQQKNRYFGINAMKVTSPTYYSPFVAPITLKEKFIKDTNNFFKRNNLIGNSNFKTEIFLIINRLKKSSTDIDAIIKLKEKIQHLDSQRKTDITKFIPNFYQYI